MTQQPEETCQRTCRGPKSIQILISQKQTLISSIYQHHLNPKAWGLFGQLDMREGGLIQSILEKRSQTPPNFILEQQTVSHMKAEVFS